jgi:hypothetical protein
MKLTFTAKLLIVSLFTVLPLVGFLVVSGQDAKKPKSVVFDTKSPVILENSQVLTLGTFKTFTSAEWREMTKDDEVCKLVDRVSAAALAKDYWKVDFRRAFYDSFHEQLAKYLMDKYNQGNAFGVKGEKHE